ncbi:hypothetical protein ACF1A5_13365 [Streptomyces sp. NPDC014864]|uniref:hypothetical protein n=1 Tax=Streptomyces sp. NPDC014864 TaxID=3364924 RepID=UPI0037008B97
MTNEPRRPVRERQVVSDLLDKVGRALLAQDTPAMEDVKTFAELVQAHADLIAARTEASRNYYESKDAQRDGQ